MTMTPPARSRDDDEQPFGALLNGDGTVVEMPVAFIRLYTGADGHSYFEDVRPQGKASGVIESDMRAAFSTAVSAGTVAFRYVLDEADDAEPHNAPRRQFIVMLKGECEVESSSGEKRRLGPGGVLLVEDLDGYGHVTRRIGDENRLTLLIPLEPERTTSPF